MTQHIANEAVSEIEVTPEMVRAGAKAWLSFDARFEEIDDVVIRIWRAMKKSDSSGAVTAILEK